MKKMNLNCKTDLVEASKRGVLIYYGDRLTSLEELSYLQWACEEHICTPEFIVKDENGEVTEIWYSDESSIFLL